MLLFLSFTPFPSLFIYVSCAFLSFIVSCRPTIPPSNAHCLAYLTISHFGFSIFSFQTFSLVISCFETLAILSALPSLPDVLSFYALLLFFLSNSAPSESPQLAQRQASPLPSLHKRPNVFAKQWKSNMPNSK